MKKDTWSGFTHAQLRTLRKQSDELLVLIYIAKLLEELLRLQRLKNMEQRTK